VERKMKTGIYGVDHPKYPRFREACQERRKATRPGAGAGIPIPLHKCPVEDGQHDGGGKLI
jgi:hypothetical protein